MFVGITIKDLRPKALTDAEAAGYDIQELKTGGSAQQRHHDRGLLEALSRAT